MSHSIGLIESKGLIALIEAADVVLKNSPAKILGIKKLENGLVSLAVYGDSNYVKAAIESAVDAGRRVGEIYASTVVDDPADELVFFISDLFAFKDRLDTSSSKIITKNVSNLMHENKNEPIHFTETTKRYRKESNGEQSKPLYVSKINSIRDTKKMKVKPSSESIVTRYTSLSDSNQNIKIGPGYNDKSVVSEKHLSTIERLRIEALGLEHKKSIVSKKSLSAKTGSESRTINFSRELAEVDFDAINQMNVHKLRNYARKFPEFPIRGRAISRANRDELIELFKSISNK